MKQQMSLTQKAYDWKLVYKSNKRIGMQIKTLIVSCTDVSEHSAGPSTLVSLILPEIHARYGCCMIYVTALYERHTLRDTY
jgi:hypothetical protein